MINHPVITGNKILVSFNLQKAGANNLKNEYNISLLLFLTISSNVGMSVENNEHFLIFKYSEKLKKKLRQKVEGK